MLIGSSLLTLRCIYWKIITLLTKDVFYRRNYFPANRQHFFRAGNKLFSESSMFDKKIMIKLLMITDCHMAMEVFMVEKMLIMEKALEVFGEAGFYLATIEDIAVKSNLDKPVINKYFQNKEALFIELLNTARIMRRREVFAVIGLSDNVKEQLSRFIISTLRFARNHRNYQQILTASVSATYPEAHNKLVEAREEFRNQVYQIIQAGVRQGKFRTVNPLIVTVFLEKLLEGTVAVVEAKSGYAADQIVLSMLDLIWNGLSCKGETANPANQNEQLISK
jgi:AcrR family transcriptional regulator